MQLILGLRGWVVAFGHKSTALQLGIFGLNSKSLSSPTQVGWLKGCNSFWWGMWINFQNQIKILKGCNSFWRAMGLGSGFDHKITALQLGIFWTQF